MYEKINSSMYDDLGLRCYLIFSLQDFDKSGAYAEILEGVARQDHHESHHPYR